MKIIDKDVRADFRRGPCEHCGAGGPTHAAHLFACGMASGKRADVYFNLCALCWKCHGKHHDGQEPTFMTLIVMVAKREGLTTQQIIAEIFRIRRLPKEATYECPFTRPRHRQPEHPGGQHGPAHPPGTGLRQGRRDRVRRRSAPAGQGSLRPGHPPDQAGRQWFAF